MFQIRIDGDGAQPPDRHTGDAEQLGQRELGVHALSVFKPQLIVFAILSGIFDIRIAAFRIPGVDRVLLAQTLGDGGGAGVVDGALDKETVFIHVEARGPKGDLEGELALVLDPGIRVLDRACPLFVPLVEGGHIAADDPIAVPAVEYYLREFREWGADTLILGCTHYPLLAPLIQRYLGEGVTLVSSGREAARATGERLGQLGLLSGREAGGRSRYFVTDDAGSFSAVAEVFLETPVTDVTPVEIARLEQLEL